MILDKEINPSLPQFPHLFHYLSDRFVVRFQRVHIGKELRTVPGAQQVLSKDKLILLIGCFSEKALGTKQGTKRPNGVFQSLEVRQTSRNEDLQ